MPKKTIKAKTRTYKKTNKQNSIRSLLKNKWVIVGLVLVVAVAGIIALRASQASGLSGRMPETGEPHVDYTFNPLNGTVTLKKSTNGQTRVAPNIDEAYVIGQQMYDEMIAAQTPPPSPTPTPAPAPSPSPTPGGSSSSSAGTSATTPASSGSSSTPTSSTESQAQQNTSATTQNSSSSNTAQTKPVFIFTLRRTVELVPKLPTNVSQVASVHYLVDGKEVGSSNQQPFTIELNTRNFSNGNHKITTSVVGKNGKVITANSYSINIDNADNPFGKLLEILGW